MVNRREFIIQAGGYTATVITVGLAGCLGKEGEDDVESAMELLDTNQDVLSEFKRLDVDTLPKDAELEGVYERLDEAESHLDAAEQVAEDEEIHDAIDLGTTVVRFQRSIAQALVAIRDALLDMETAQAQIEAERFEETLDTLDAIQTSLGDANDAVSTASQALRDIDDDVLETQERIEIQVDISQLDTFEKQLDILSRVVNGLEEMTNGLIAFDASTTAFEAENLDKAGRLARDAEDEFDTVADRYQELGETSDVPAEIESDLVELRSDATALRDGCGHYVVAIEAAQNEDWETYRAEIEAMEAAFDAR